MPIGEIFFIFTLGNLDVINAGASRSSSGRNSYGVAIIYGDAGQV